MFIRETITINKNWVIKKGSHGELREDSQGEGHVSGPGCFELESAADEIYEEILFRGGLWKHQRFP